MRSILVQVVRTTQIFIMAALHTLIYQFAVLSSLPVWSCARVAVAARKLAKDDKNQDAVEEAGYDFIVWYELCELHKQTVVESRASTKQAQKDLLQAICVFMDK